MSPDSSPLPTYQDSELRRVLCVVAHPDDMEYGGSAAVARWTARGAEVSYLLLTAGEAGMRSRDPEEAAEIRAEEQRRACELVGVSDLVILDLPDGTLEPSLDARRQIARRIRQLRPEVVLTQTWELEVAWGLNHADHRATGLATLDAVRDADNPWVFRELLEQERLEPWAVRELLVFGSAPTHVIDISGEPLQQGLASLEAHEQYLQELGGAAETRQMLESMAAEQAADLPGVDHALGVAVHQMS
ncbi:PIG-L deacetylase family protein [Nesterenkonia sandarakina]|uniref:LmbE family N-acetylglucosaminyl deacetylase n=1 Tax=Nesterenkonia sandarakina TaxID=272918 RepID=A0A7Z0E6T4_9MICC|nr:PIG-L deacetylase family protein [Nesterenkonia sandarakina]NYJ16122.1 LmbE family N-acetylglucosaminyl deacetylase [Nesterenkonia sandarakina]